MRAKSIIRRIQVRPGSKAALKKRDTAWVQFKELKQKGSSQTPKSTALRILQENTVRLASAQELLYASDTYGVLIVLQGMDAAGKDGTIKHVMSGVNPQGCEVHSFKQPSTEELNHTFLWRYSRRLPERGRIAIFNRSYYEDVLVPRVHPVWLARQRLPKKDLADHLWRRRFEDINAFEQHLVRNGIIVLKFFLHISKEEQRRRLLERLKDKSKFWKFSLSDLAERQYWRKYAQAYEHALSATSTDFAPWYIVPADHKWAAHALVADIVTDTIGSLRLRYPKGDPAVRRDLATLRNRLEG